MSMAAGEYVSVSSQSDIERADIARETKALATTPEVEERELASIFEARGLSPETAAQVAHELSRKDALAAHVREELGLSEVHAANPLQAAAASGLTFSTAAEVPLGAAVLAPAGWVIPVVWGRRCWRWPPLGRSAPMPGGRPRAGPLPGCCSGARRRYRSRRAWAMFSG